RLLDEKIADPARHFAEKEQAQRNELFQRAYGELQGQAAVNAQLKASNPIEYVSRMEAHYAKVAELLAAQQPSPPLETYRSELAQSQSRLAAFVRFALKDPARAAGIYERAIAAGAAFGPAKDPAFMARIGLADLARFDLSNSARALAIYREIQ